MARSSPIKFICSGCGQESSRWSGKCPSCNSWNTMEETEYRPGTAKISKNFQLSPLQPLSETESQESVRMTTGMHDFDQVLGGGIVSGSFVLVGGEPGVGKSTLILEIARRFRGVFYYFSGEESASQIKMRAERMGVNPCSIFLSGESYIENICARIINEKPDLAVIDSIQTLSCSGTDTSPGSISQLREAALQIMEASKKSRVPVMVTGHITKEGAIAGPRALEHMVDTVLYFESDRLNHYRILRATKNRFGPVGEVAIFEMQQNGLREVSDFEIGEIDESVPGRMFSSFVEGTRALAVEVQALVTRTVYGPGRRMAEGLDSRRLILLAAVMEKYLKLSLSDSDIFANLAGGISADDPALDLALCSAILSSYREISGKKLTAYIGEVGLSGEVRSVGHLSARIRELSGVGFRRIYLPASNVRETVPDGIELIAIKHISELLTQ